MYRKYYSEYEKRAEELRRSVPQISKPDNETKAPSKEISEKAAPTMPLSFSNLKTDDILLLALIFFLIREKNSDKMIILALGFIFISGF